MVERFHVLFKNRPYIGEESARPGFDVYEMNLLPAAWPKSWQKDRELDSAIVQPCNDGHATIYKL